MDNLQPPREAADAAAAGPPGLGAPLGFSVILAVPPRDSEGTLRSNQKLSTLIYLSFS